MKVTIITAYRYGQYEHYIGIVARVLTDQEKQELTNKAQAFPLNISSIKFDEADIYTDPFQILESIKSDYADPHIAARKRIAENVIRKAIANYDVKYPRLNIERLIAIGADINDFDTMKQLRSATAHNGRTSGKFRWVVFTSFINRDELWGDNFRDELNQVINKEGHYLSPLINEILNEVEDEIFGNPSTYAWEITDPNDVNYDTTSVGVYFDDFD